MRIWSISPRYLDKKHLITAWNDGILARESLKGEVKGRENHMAIRRFKEVSADEGTKYLDAYLYDIYQESEKTGLGYQFQS